MRMMSGTRGGFGVALGGGTARGMAHLGALSLLEERGWKPDAIAGTSSGAVVGAMVALGVPPLQVAGLIRRVGARGIWRQALDPGLLEGSLIRGRRLEAWLDREVLGGATFADVRIPFVVACTDLASGELRLLREGPLSRAVLASCALPGFFTPVMGVAGVAKDEVMVDGGLVEAVPYSALADLAPGRLLGVHTGIDAQRSKMIGFIRRAQRTGWGARWRDWALARGVAGPWSRLWRGLALAAAAYERSVEVPDGAYLLRAQPPVAWWDFHRSEEAVAAGRASAEAAYDRGDLADWLRGEPGRQGPAERREGVVP